MVHTFNTSTQEAEAGRKKKKSNCCKILNTPKVLTKRFSPVVCACAFRKILSLKVKRGYFHKPGLFFTTPEAEEGGSQVHSHAELNDTLVSKREKSQAW